jgi:hypothetical protein
MSSTTIIPLDKPVKSEADVLITTKPSEPAPKPVEVPVMDVTPAPAPSQEKPAEAPVLSPVPAAEQPAPTQLVPVDPAGEVKKDEPAPQTSQTPATVP